MQIKMVGVNEIIPYENNPRKNDGAVAAVAESIRQCGYVAPLIVDENMVVLAGHTRLKALKSVGGGQVDVIVRDGLTEEQKKKYRILDNKTNEFADWDMEALEKELEGIDLGDFDFGFDFDEEPEEKERKEVNVSDGEYQIIVDFFIFASPPVRRFSEQCRKLITWHHENRNIKFKSFHYHFGNTSGNIFFGHFPGIENDISAV